MGDLDLDALERLAAEATPGPWCLHPNGTSVWTGMEYDSNVPGQVMVLRCAQKPDGGLPQTIDDLDFVIEAREAVPVLVAEVRRLRDHLHAVEVVAFNIADGCDAMDQVTTEGATLPEPLRESLTMLVPAVDLRDAKAEVERLTAERGYFLKLEEALIEAKRQRDTFAREVRQLKGDPK